MPSAQLNQIEQAISQLSYEERLWLMERLVQSLRQVARPSFESSLAEMATDPEIQRELKGL